MPHGGRALPCPRNLQAAPSGTSREQLFNTMMGRLLETGMGSTGEREQACRGCCVRTSCVEGQNALGA
jgi:hypothetical protein